MQSAAMAASRTPVCDATALQHYLSLPVTPVNLAELSRLRANKVDASVVHQLVREMAIRTSRCYLTFSDPVMQKTMQKPHAERLQWVQSYVLREFSYCVALHHSIERSRHAGPFDRSTSLDFQRSEHYGSSSLFARMRSTEDDSCIYQCSYAHAKRSASRDGTAACNTDKSESQQIGSFSCGSSSTMPSGIQSLGLSPHGGITREEVVAALEKWDQGKATIPFLLALELLQPRQSLLDVMVNEAAVRSDELNGWFSRFCRRRVAWRVLHEHLLHLTSPAETPQVIAPSTDIAAIIRDAGNVVLDIFADLIEDGSVHALKIDVEEDAHILHQVPSGTLASSSTTSFACPVSVPEKQLITPASSAAVYSVEGHLSYIFREVLKNACAATLKFRPDIDVLIKYAMDDAWVVVDFIDRAGGIHSKFYKDVWKFGWTTSEHYESHLGGFGVGLPTSKVYMDMWGGSIDLHSTMGYGTTVRVRFPKAPVETRLSDLPLTASAF